MKKNFSNFYAIIFILVSFSFAHAQDLPAEKKQKLDEIGAVLEKAMIDSDYETILKFYDEEVIIMPGFSPAIKGINAFKNTYEKNVKIGLKYHSFTGSVEKRWICGDQIYEMGTFGMAVSSRESSIPKAYYGSYFQIWQEYEDGSFKIKYNIWNLDFNPFEHNE